MITPDTWAYTNRLAAAHPAEKCLLTCLMLSASLAAGSAVSAALVFCLMSGLTILKAGIPAQAYGKILFAPCAFIFIGSAAVMLEILPGSGQVLTVRTDGLNLAAAVFCRSLGATSCLLFLCLTTPVADIAGLLGRLKLPGLLVDLVLLTYRCIFILAEAAEKIIRAQATRLGYASMTAAFRSSGLLAGSVLMRSLEDARLMQQSFDSRCGDGPLGSPKPESGVSAANIIFMLLAAAAIAASGF